VVKRIISAVFLLFLFIGVSFSQQYYENEILFCLKPNRPALKIEHGKSGVQTDRPAINRLLQNFGAVQVEKWLPMADARDVVDGVELSKIYRVVFKDKKDRDVLETILKKFRSVQDVQSAAQEAINRIDADFQPYIPNDPYFKRQWYLNKIMAPDAWGLWGDNTPGDSTVLVGVVDTGIDYTHPDLADAMWVNLGEDANGDGKITAEDENGIDDDGNGYVDDFMGWDFANQDNDVMPPDPGPHYELSHGTHVSGIIAAVADNGIGIAGVSFRSKLIVTKNAADNDLTNPTIVKGYSGVLYCAKMGAKIINCSWGGGYDLYGKLVVDNVTKNYGAIVVAAAGNDAHSNDENHSYPSDYDNVVSVAALNNADKKAYYSNWGKVVDISAPGGEGSSYTNAILSTIHVSAGSYISWQGTSMATPVVAGALALLKAWFPNDSRGDLLSALLNNADPLDAKNPDYKGLLGAGRVNVYNAIARGIFPKITLESYRWFNSDSTDPMPGDSLRLSFTLNNQIGWQDAYDMQLHLRSASPYVQILDSVFTIDSLHSGQTIDSGYVQTCVKILKNAPYQPIDFNLVITANDTGAYPYKEVFNLNVNPMRYQSGFPLKGYYFVGALSLVKLISGEKVTVGVTNEGDLFVFNADGSVRKNFPIEVGAIKNAPAIGDVDHNGKKDIVVVNRDGTVWVIDFDGKVLFKDALKESVYGDVALVNMDEDPQLEIIFATMRKNVHVLKTDSTEISGFPKTMPSLVNMGTALADFDGDLLPDIVLGTFDGNLHVITNRGDSLANFPVKLSARLSATPVVVEQKGQLFIIAPTNDHKLFKITEQGQVAFEKTFNDNLVGSPAIADLDGDNSPEIVVGSRDGYLYAFHFNGTLVDSFPVALNSAPQASILCQDVDNDGRPEILLMTGNGYLHLFRNNGREAVHFPAYIGENLYAVPVIGDLDSDGDAELILGTNGRLIALDLQTPLNGNTFWETYLGSNYRTSSYAVEYTGVPKEANPTVPENITLYQNFPNPFNMQTTIRFFVPKKTGHNTATLTVYNVLGQKIRTFNLGKITGKNGRVVWDGRNEAGNVVTSGIYFYRLTVGTHSQMRRMLLIK